MKIPSTILAPLVAAFFLGAIFLGNSWKLPTMEQEFREAEGREEVVEMIVRNLTCRGKSNFFLKRLESVDGVISVSTYVQEQRASIKYDTSKTDPERIKHIIEKQVRLQDGSMVQPFQVLDIDR